MTRWLVCALLCGCRAVAATPPLAPEPRASASEAAPPAETPQPVAVRINAEYAKRDAASWTASFEHDGREVYDRRHEIVAALGLTAGQRVADVGAGSGLFTLLFAAAVGPSGRVWAIDVQPDLVASIAARAHAASLANIDARLGDQRGAGLDTASIDVAFLCDAYHHLELPQTYLADLRRALVPGGRLVIIDYDRTRKGTRAWMREHIRADPARFREEVEAAGFEWQSSPLALDENFVAVFTRSP